MMQLATKRANNDININNNNNMSINWPLYGALGPALVIDSYRYARFVFRFVAFRWELLPVYGFH